MRIVGLTGSIGMGKSTACEFFRKLGTPVFDADLAVHILYVGEAVPLIEAAFPGTTLGGKVDRQELAARVLADQAALEILESIVHPLVHVARAGFLAEAKRANCVGVVLDIPLLFETAAQGSVDVVATVSAPESIQADRVLRRSGMTEKKFGEIKSRQWPDAEKRRRSHAVIETGGTLDFVRRQVVDLNRSLMSVEPRRGSKHA